MCVCDSGTNHRRHMHHSADLWTWGLLELVSHQACIGTVPEKRKSARPIISARAIANDVEEKDGA